MATNPMQRKANTYLLIGVSVTLLITGSIIAILFMQLTKLRGQSKKEDANVKTVAVLSQDVNSGDAIPGAKQVKVTGEAVPSNAISSSQITDKTKAKIDLKAGTVLTADMLYEEDEANGSSVRNQEYNMLDLPTQIKTGDYIDVRLRLPNGTDYIVVSKKKVEIPEIGGIESANTIKIQVSEEETLLMSNAIVEAYWAVGSKLYVATYVEPGLQDQATATYLPNNEVISLINSNPNIVNVAKNALITRYNSQAGTVRTDIVNTLNIHAEDKEDNIQSGVQEEITRAKEERQMYLDALGGY